MQPVDGSCPRHALHARRVLDRLSAGLRAGGSGRLSLLAAGREWQPVLPGILLERSIALLGSGWVRSSALLASVDIQIKVGKPRAILAFVFMICERGRKRSRHL